MHGPVAVGPWVRHTENEQMTSRRAGTIFQVDFLSPCIRLKENAEKSAKEETRRKECQRRKRSLGIMLQEEEQKGEEEVEGEEGEGKEADAVKKRGAVKGFSATTSHRVASKSLSSEASVPAPDSPSSSSSSSSSSSPTTSFSGSSEDAEVPELPVKPSDICTNPFQNEFCWSGSRKDYGSTTRATPQKQDEKQNQQQKQRGISNNTPARRTSVTAEYIKRNSLRFETLQQHSSPASASIYRVDTNSFEDDFHDSSAERMRLKQLNPLQPQLYREDDTSVPSTTNNTSGLPKRKPPPRPSLPPSLASFSAPTDELTLSAYLRSIVELPSSLRVLCLTNFFCWMSLVSYSLFFTDFVGQAVYGGDPGAPLGHSSRRIYDTGVRVGSLAMALYSISCSM